MPHSTIILLDDDVVPMSDYWAYGAAKTFASDPGLSIVRVPMVIEEFKSDLSDIEKRKVEISLVHSKRPASTDAQRNTLWCIQGHEGRNMALHPLRLYAIGTVSIAAG